jgi:hypothetical protein
MDKHIPRQAVLNEIALLARRKMDRSQEIIIDNRLQLNAAVRILFTSLFMQWIADV